MKTQEQEQKNTRVTIHLRGNLSHLSHKLHALTHATILGLKTHALIKEESGGLELTFEGDKKKLWKMIDWSKKGSPFSEVKEVMFYFK